MITGDQNYLATYNIALRTIQNRIDAIATLTARNPAQRARISRIERLVPAKLKTIQIIVDTRNAGAIDAALLLVSMEQDKLEMNRIRAVLDQMKAAESAFLTEQIAARDDAYRNFWWSFGALVSAMFAGAIWQYRQLRKIMRLKEEAEQRILHLAEHDALTGLANRRLLRARLDLGIAYAKRNGQMLAVIFLDLDGFKQVNDNLGHEAGDELLKAVSQRLQQAVRSNDTVARLGGDEFVVVLSEVADLSVATAVANKLIQVLALPHRITGRDVQISASIGLSNYPNHGDIADMLLSKADKALYQAKAAGKNRYKMAA
ncbi:diguanylate cyclase domain-containing protein [Undibacterium arcticum]